MALQKIDFAKPMSFQQKPDTALLENQKTAMHQAEKNRAGNGATETPGNEKLQSKKMALQENGFAGKWLCKKMACRKQQSCKFALQEIPKLEISFAPR